MWAVCRLLYLVRSAHVRCGDDARMLVGANGYLTCVLNGLHLCACASVHFGIIHLRKRKIQQRHVHTYTHAPLQYFDILFFFASYHMSTCPSQAIPLCHCSTHTHTHLVYTHTYLHFGHSHCAKGVHTYAFEPLRLHTDIYAQTHPQTHEKKATTPTHTNTSVRPFRTAHAPAGGTHQSAPPVHRHIRTNTSTNTTTPTYPQTQQRTNTHLTGLLCGLFGPRTHQPAVLIEPLRLHTLTHA